MSAMKPGDVLFEVTLPPAGRARLAAFSEGTQDPNPIHVDEAFAKGAGFPTVLQQGPMTTAQFARLLDEYAGAGRTRVLDVLFTAPVFPDDSLVLKAEVVEVGDIVRCALTANKADGAQTAKGTAEFAR
ncbi:MaoC family dehydratase [Pseudorhodoplanes sp.]|uniref:MaoC family dehydratase n=1 Tax=Pseudorhodoplanes sp. TaxID=1934341 RepID=UPI003D12F7FE